MRIQGLGTGATCNKFQEEEGQTSQQEGLAGQEPLTPNKARGELERTGRAEARTTEGVLGLRQQVVQAEQGILHPSTLLLFSAS